MRPSPYEWLPKLSQSLFFFPWFRHVYYYSVSQSCCISNFAIANCAACFYFKARPWDLFLGRFPVFPLYTQKKENLMRNWFQPKCHYDPGFRFHTLSSIHTQYIYKPKTITRPKPEWSLTHFDTLYHPVFTRVVKIASLHPSICTRFDDWRQSLPTNDILPLIRFFSMTQIFHSILLFTGLDIWPCIIWGQMRIVYAHIIFVFSLIAK